jgi:hypothetical protein
VRNVQRSKISEDDCAFACGLAAGPQGHDAVERTMRPHATTGSVDRFRARLDQIINMKYELVQLAGKI